MREGREGRRSSDAHRVLVLDREVAWAGSRRLVCARDPVVWLGANALSWPEGGGNLWVFLNWALGFRALGCRVIWLRVSIRRSLPPNCGPICRPWKRDFDRYGLADMIAVYYRTDEPWKKGSMGGSIAIEEAEDADLLVNMSYELPDALAQMFRRTAVLDIDPGLTQVWMSEGVGPITRHDRYFTTGEGVNGRFGPAGRLACTYRRVSPWIGGLRTGRRRWFHDGFKLGQPRMGHLSRSLLPEHQARRFLAVPRSSSDDRQSLELALCIEADEELHLSEYSQAERDSLKARGWGVVHSYEVASTPWDYQSYIRRSKGEFSAASPPAPSCRQVG